MNHQRISIERDTLRETNEELRCTQAQQDQLLQAGILCVQITPVLECYYKMGKRAMWHICCCMQKHVNQRLSCSGGKDDVKCFQIKQMNTKFASQLRSERAFSTCGYILEQRRMNIKPSLVNNILFQYGHIK